MGSYSYSYNWFRLNTCNRTGRFWSLSVLIPSTRFMVKVGFKEKKTRRSNPMPLPDSVMHGSLPIPRPRENMFPWGWVRLHTGYSYVTYPKTLARDMSVWSSCKERESFCFWVNGSRLPTKIKICWYFAPLSFGRPLIRSLRLSRCPPGRQGWVFLRA